MTFQEMLDCIKQQYDYPLIELQRPAGEYYQLRAHGECWTFSQTGEQVCMSAPSSSVYADRAVTTLPPAETLAAFNQYMALHQRWADEDTASYGTAACVEPSGDWLLASTPGTVWEWGSNV